MLPNFSSRVFLAPMAGVSDPAINDLGQHHADIHGDLPPPLLSSATAMGQR